MNELNVFIGTDESVIIDFLKEIIEEKYVTNYKFNFISAYIDSDIIEVADKKSFDIFILHLNNILCTGDYTSSTEVICRGVEFISFIKGRYNKPIISFSVFKEYAGKAEKAGALSFIRLPFEIKEFESAFDKSLESISCES